MIAWPGFAATVDVRSAKKYTLSQGDWQLCEDHSAGGTGCCITGAASQRYCQQNSSALVFLHTGS